MRPRVFFALAATAFGAVALGGLTLSFAHVHEHDLGTVLIAALASLAFAAVAWIEPPAPRDACGTCQGGTLLGLGFCTSCGGSTDERRA